MSDVMRRVRQLGVMAAVLGGNLFGRDVENDWFPHQSVTKESNDKIKGQAVEKSLHEQARKEHTREFMSFHNSRGARPNHISKKEWKEQSHYLFEKWRD